MVVRRACSWRETLPDHLDGSVTLLSSAYQLGPGNAVRRRSCWSLRIRKFQLALRLVRELGHRLCLPLPVGERQW